MSVSKDGSGGMAARKATNVVWHPHKVTRGEREAIKGHRPCVVWLTGLPSSGKSTIAIELEHLLNEQGIHAYVLDGDNVRHGLNSDLGFSREDRVENIRRIGEVAKLFVDAGVIPIAAFISPFRQDRDQVRNLLGTGEFVEVYVKCSLDECKRRDPKGLYRKAESGEVQDFTGVSQVYEEPLRPDLTIETDKTPVAAAVAAIVDHLVSKGIFPAKAG